MKNDRSPGLYVHVPFCRGKCPYCDFYSEAPLGRTSSLVGAVVEEARLRRGEFEPFGSLYIGGGTPSLLEPDEFTRLMGELTGVLPITADPEVTVEVNPDDLTPDLASAYRDLSVNRLSIGIQSLDDGELVFLGRRHDSASALLAFQTAREAGFGNIGIDLIYGFARQGRSSWEKTLARAADLGPEHISCYQLTVHEGTPFGRLAGTGAAIQVDEHEQREMFLETSRYLTGMGYIHYEVSNFAREERYVSSHNSRYWMHVDYLGLGPSAHSFRKGERWWNLASVDSYISKTGSGSLPVSGSEVLTREQLSLESLFLGFRWSRGVPLEVIAEYPRGREILDGLVERGLAEVKGGSAVPTVEGYLVADAIPLLFAGSR